MAYDATTGDTAWSKGFPRFSLEEFLRGYFFDNFNGEESTRGIVLAFLDKDSEPRTYVGVPYGINGGELHAGAYQKREGELPSDFHMMSKWIKLTEIVACSGFELPKKQRMGMMGLRLFGGTPDSLVECL